MLRCPSGCRRQPRGGAADLEGPVILLSGHRSSEILRALAPKASTMSMTSVYLPGDDVPAAALYPSRAARLHATLARAASLATPSKPAVVEIDGGDLREYNLSTRKGAVAMLHARAMVPLNQVTSVASTPQMAARMLLEFGIYHRGTCSKTPHTREYLSRKALDRTLATVTKALGGSDYAETVRTHVRSALGMHTGVSGVYLEPRSVHTTVLDSQSPERAADTLLQSRVPLVESEVFPEWEADEHDQEAETLVQALASLDRPRTKNEEQRLQHAIKVAKAAIMREHDREEAQKPTKAPTAAPATAGPKPVKDGPLKKVSFCTGIKNRLYQFKDTILQNLKDAEGYNAEFVILNYNSNDGLDEWVKANLMDYIHQGRVRYVVHPTAGQWDASRAKNLAHAAATGDIVVCLDGDNYIGDSIPDYFNCLNDNPDQLIHMFSGDWDDGSFGRIGMTKQNFLDLGGYDEQMHIMYFEDFDLINRAKWYGLKYVQFDDASKVKAIFNPRDAGASSLNEKRLNLENQKRSVHNLKRDQFTANIEHGWANAKCQVNFGEWVDLSQKAWHHNHKPNWRELTKLHPLTVKELLEKERLAHALDTNHK